ncbi:4Fe-4S dicluster domain-containing protein [Syntrophomonas palmitatica]|uniref:4Fe-4S dicluster domain-containing protein n=1 Tax=Syntrophomonas palmitatica TaxID=402877 RepID=UPI0009F8FBC5|nr:4Fe-4S dicluster domain-containing protein [Syntrophomonas palmitatica]
MPFIYHQNGRRGGGTHQLRGHLSTKYITIQSQNCTACGSCISQCPKNVIGKVHFLRHEHAHIDNADKCVGCRKCVKSCPNQAIFELPQIDFSEPPPQIPSKMGNLGMGKRRCCLNQKARNEIESLVTC